jgi:acetyl-CoA carboxylase biotin carboxyl carrier protein
MNKNILGIFDGSDIEGITALIGKLEESSFDYLKLEGDGVKLVIGKNGAGEADVSVLKAQAPAAVSVTAVKPETAEAPALVPEAPVPASAAATASAAKPAGAVAEQAGVFIVKSPSYGIFYAQPEPGAPTYVKLGDTVKKGDTLCLIEIMKTFNALSAEVDGVITGIHVQNQEVLEPDMPLFSIRIK